MTTATTQSTRPGVWAGLFAVNTALIAVLRISGALEMPAPAILMALNLLLLVPLGRALLQRQEDQGASSQAIRRYNRRVLASMAFYAATMLLAGNLYDSVQPQSPAMWLLASAPVLPVLAVLWAMVRYYREEQDEYLRQRHVAAALIGLVLVLGLGTLWGFFEMFGLVPHVWNWWVFPVWAIGLGLGSWWPRNEGDGA